MSRKVLHFPELDLGLGFLARSDVRAPCSVNLITGRARLQCVGAGPESRSRESKAALSIGDNTDADRGAVFLRADHHAFHRTFLGGGDLPGQSQCRLTLRRTSSGLGLKAN